MGIVMVGEGVARNWTMMLPAAPGAYVAVLDKLGLRHPVIMHNQIGLTAVESAGL